MKGIHIGLLPRILVAIVLGIGFGCFLPGVVVRGFATFNSIFSHFLQFLIPLIIIGLVTPAIAEIGKGAGVLLAITALIAYLDTVFAGCFSYLTSVLVFGSQQLKGLASEFKDIVVKTIETAILPLLPIYIFGIFLSMTYTGQAWSVLKVFVSIIGVIFLMHIVLLVLQFCVAGAVTHRNPFRLLGTMMPAYFTALGTSSSAATIPVTLNQTLKNGVSAEVAGFTVPLCATIHLSGSTLKIVSCAVALMMMQDMPFDAGMFLGFILMLGIMMVAAPGVPGGAIMAALGVLGSVLGFGEQEQALMIALYITMDNFGTACNVTGDGAIALVIDKFFRKRT